MMRIGPRAALLLLTPLAECSGAEPAPIAGMVSVGGHALHVAIRGAGGPPVVVDAGLGSLAEEWYPLQDALASETLVVVYDRAGYGASEPGPLPRDSGREADELKALLDAASVPGPYVLVGHSLGGLNAQAFAARYPDAVAGLVLLDPPPLDWITGGRFPKLRDRAMAMTAEWEARAVDLADSELPEARAEADFLRMIASEHREMLGRSARLTASIRSFGDIPLRVIASGVPNPMFGVEAERYQEYWASQSRQLAARSERGQFLMVEGSTHALHRDATDRVRAAILEVVAEARR